MRSRQQWLLVDPRAPCQWRRHVLARLSPASSLLTHVLPVHLRRRLNPMRSLQQWLLVDLRAHLQWQRHVLVRLSPASSLLTHVLPVHLRRQLNRMRSRQQWLLVDLCAHLQWRRHVLARLSSASSLTRVLSRSPHREGTQLRRRQGSQPLILMSHLSLRVPMNTPAVAAARRPIHQCRKSARRSWCGRLLLARPSPAQPCHLGRASVQLRQAHGGQRRLKLLARPRLADRRHLSQ